MNSEMHKYLVFLQKLCPANTRAVLVAAILTTMFVFGFRTLTDSPGDESTTSFAAVGQKSLTNHSSSYESKSREFPAVGNGETPGEEIWDSSVDLNKENLHENPLPVKRENKTKKKKERKWRKFDRIETISLESRELIDECILAKDRREMERLRQSAMSLSDMDQLASRNRESCSLVSVPNRYPISNPLHAFVLQVPRWISPRDHEILEARKQILNAPRVKFVPDLYPPLFRNFSMFKR